MFQWRFLSIWSQRSSSDENQRLQLSHSNSWGWWPVERKCWSRDRYVPVSIQYFGQVAHSSIVAARYKEKLDARRLPHVLFVWTQEKLTMPGKTQVTSRESSGTVAERLRDISSCEIDEWEKAMNVEYRIREFITSKLVWVGEEGEVTPAHQLDRLHSTRLRTEW